MLPENQSTSFEHDTCRECRNRVASACVRLERRGSEGRGVERVFACLRLCAPPLRRPHLFVPSRAAVSITYLYSMSLLDAAPRQYENNDSSPAALAFFAEFDGSRQSTPATSPPPAPHDPPAEVVTDVIVTLVDGRSDALAILQATAARLSFNLLSTRQGPAVQLPDAPIVPTIASLDDLAASFAQWRDHARQCHCLRKLDSSYVLSSCHE